jgi:hypothetical protein
MMTAQGLIFHDTPPSLLIECSYFSDYDEFSCDEGPQPEQR